MSDRQRQEGFNPAKIIKIYIENLDELNEMLQQAMDQIEQLQTTLKKINQFTAIIKSSES